MLLTLTTTHRPATDLGFLLHKNPARAQSFTLGFGTAHVFYPEAREDACTAVLLLEVDPIALSRGQPGRSASVPLEPYVNDRPYAASSFLSVALAEVFGTALAGHSRERPELAATPLPLEARVPALPCRGGAPLLHQLFAPLGYRIEAAEHPLDPRFPEWGESPYLDVRLSGTVLLKDLLAHLYVLIPVLDDQKHYWVDESEIDKLLRAGAGWLPAHPERELITSRYLKRFRGLTREALARLAPEDDPDPDATEAAHDAAEAVGEASLGLNVQRIRAVVAALEASGARRVLDLGCGEGQLLRALLEVPQFDAIVGMDVSVRALEAASRRLQMDRLPERQRARLTLLHGSLVYRDARLAGYDAAALVEVIEHLEPTRLTALERVVFGAARPGTVVLTTPNSEYNAAWPTLAGGSSRHLDHRFEWTRTEFRAWAEGVSARNGYAVAFRPVGPEDPMLGPPTQMGIFTRG